MRSRRYEVLRSISAWTELGSFESSGTIDTLVVIVESAYRPAQESSVVFRLKTSYQDLKKAVRKDSRERMHDDALSLPLS